MSEKMRGTIYCTMQSGQLDLRVANLSDVKQITQVRAAAQSFIDQKYKLSEYPTLQKIVNQNRSVTNLN